MPTTDSPLNPRIEKSLRECYETLLKREEFLTKERLAEYHALFRERFGPERLQTSTARCY